MTQQQPEAGGAEVSDRPTARRVAARALVLAAVAGRADLERDLAQGIHDLQQNEQARVRLLRWVRELGLESELEPDETQFLETPMAQANERTVIDAQWRAEGMAVLAWALKRAELLAYDVMADDKVVLQSIGFMSPASEQDLRRTAALRPASEIDRFASHITIVSWRLTQYRVVDQQAEAIRQELKESNSRGARAGMDFVGYLRVYTNFQDRWLEDLRLIDGDLAIGEKAIAEASADEVKTATSIATERQIAAYWLQGDNPTYSKVSPDTFLSAV